MKLLKLNQKMPNSIFVDAMLQSIIDAVFGFSVISYAKSETGGPTKLVSLFFAFFFFFFHFSLKTDRKQTT